MLENVHAISDLPSASTPEPEASETTMKPAGQKPLKKIKERRTYRASKQT